MPSSNLFKIIDGVHHFDFDAVITHLRHQGKSRYGPHFDICAGDYEVYYQLLGYLVGDTAICYKYNLISEKGLLLIGPVGSGKTCMLELLSSLFVSRPRYRMVTARAIALDFDKRGYQCLSTYSKRSIAIDDLGAEPSIHHYGQSANILSELLSIRYDLYRSKGTRTYATTNLDPAALESRYGQRIRSRLREMCNVIVVDGEDKRG